MGIREEEKISLEKCKAILNKGKRKYSDQEIKEIRDFLYVLGEMAYENYKKLKDKE